VKKSFPHLTHLQMEWQALDVDRLSEQGDWIFFATPAGVSSQWAPAFLQRDCKVVDLSGDFRLSADSYQEWYGREPADEEWLNQAVYGLSEWYASAIAKAQLISNPGCYPTASLLALLPVLKAGLIDQRQIIIDAKSGISGAGRSAVTDLLFSERQENVKPYKTHGHQHIPEIERYAQESGRSDTRVTFIPHLIPMVRGLIVTIYSPLQRTCTHDEVAAIYQEHYQEKPFVRLMQEVVPQTKQVLGSNYCDIGWQIDQRTGQLILVAVIDNLVKGAAGQAIQNANLQAGLPEGCGLENSPLHP
jgi:N-acetyl-gamma-glutamyl-phosphate reductase